MANLPETANSIAARQKFDTVVDHLVMKNLAQNLLPELKGLAGIKHTGEEFGGVQAGGGKDKNTERGV